VSLLLAILLFLATQQLSETIVVTASALPEKVGSTPTRRPRAMSPTFFAKSPV